MKTQMTAFEIRHMVKELQILLDSRVNQIYQPKGVMLQLHKSNIGKFYLRIEPNALWLTETKQEMPQKIQGLCQALRKYVKGKKVTKIEQIGSERIIVMELETQKEQYYLYIELFAQGNIILADENKKIIKALEERAWKDRTIQRNEEYKLPPVKKNIFELSEEAFTSKTEKDLATMGFGKLYAQEIMSRATGKSAKALYEAYQTLMKSKSSPHVYDREITPIQLKGKEGKKYKTFSEAIADNWKEEIIVKKKETKLDKVTKQIEMQQNVVEELEKKAVIEQRKGELIYEHYQKVKDALDKAKGPKKITIDLD